MKVTDKNETLQPPKGFEAYDVRADGAYLRLEYSQTKYVPDPTDKCMGQRMDGWTTVVIYLNDQGREVLRTEVYTRMALPLPDAIPKPWYFKFADMILDAFNA
jgi:hypothetical protein